MQKRTETEPKILECLALHSPASKYQIAKITKKSYANIHEVVKKLKERNLIKIVKVEVSIKNPKMEVEYYALTELGLYYALQSMDITEKALDRISERYDDICLTFRKWKFIEDKEIRQFIIKILNAKLREEWFLISLQLFRKMKSSIDEEEVKSRFKSLDEMIFGLLPILPFKFKKKLLQLIKSDKELLSYTLNYINKVIKDQEEFSRMLEETKNLLLQKG